jgi:hypothetical protein
LFVWMKLWQAMFARRLAADLAREAPAPIRGHDLLRVIGSQTLVHSTGLFLIPIAANLLLPSHWVFAFYQNATALAFREPTASGLFRRSWKQACVGPLQGHAALAVLALFGLFMFLNVAITMLSVPFLMKTILGIETNFTLSVQSSVNTTFLASALGVTYLGLDPLIKATYALRCFYGQSRQSGEDLRVAIRSSRAPAAAVLTALLLLGQPAFTSRAGVPEPKAPVETSQAEKLNQSIDDVLDRPEYTWRSPRPKVEKNKKSESAQWIRDAARAIRDWFEKVFSRSGRTRVTPPGAFSFSAHGLIYILIAVVVVVIASLAWLLWRSRTQSTIAGTGATPAAPLPDLAREDVAGDELPEDGWTRLALELLERGDLRLAMRAFYLSSLAHLAGRNLVSIARFKSNRDYERELWRRSHALPDLTSTFSENVSVFDRVWYGMHEINGELVQRFRGNVERIRSC